MADTTITAAPSQANAPVPATTATNQSTEPPAPQPGATPIPPTSAEPTPAAGPTSAPAPEPTAPPTTSTPASKEPASTAAKPEPTSAVTAKPEPTKSEKSAENSDEPQNDLTRKFTEAEWKALKEFRAKLPEIFDEAYTDKAEAKAKPLNMWGVTIDPNNPKNARTSVVLMKFLRARNLSIQEAKSMLVATMRWRESFKIDSVLDEKFPDDIFGNMGHIAGHDKDGRPVVYNIYGGNQDVAAVFGDVQRFLRWRIALHERSIMLLDFEKVDQTVQIHDYEGVSLSSRTANSKQAASEASSIFQDHYPELLYKKFFINVPTLMTWIFWAFKPLISAATLAKMSVVGSGQHTIKKALLPIVNEDQLPKRYGGSLDADF